MSLGLKDWVFKTVSSVTGTFDLPKNRGESGFSLASVTAFTVVAGCWLLMTANVSLPVYQKAAEYRQLSTARNSAEAGLDYVVSQLDSAYRSNQASIYDDLTIDSSGKSTSIPENVIGSGAAVTVSVTNIRAPQTAAVYNARLDDAQLGNVVANTNLWRVVSSTATYAGLTSTVRVVLAPVMTASESSSGSGSGSGGTSSTPFFQYAMFSQNALSTSGNLQTDAYDSRNGPYGGSNRNPFRGNVGSNTSVSIGGNTIIGGNLIVRSSPLASTTVVVATRGANAIVQNQVKVNGITGGFSATNGLYPLFTDNVRAMEYSVPRWGDYLTPIDKSLAQPAVALSVAPSAPSGSYNVGAISISGNAVVVVRNGSPAVSSINVSSNTTYIPPGNYQASSFTISGNGQLRIEGDVATNTVISLEGNTPGANVAQIAGNGVANLTQIPAKFQVLTNSSKNVLVSGNGDFRGVIYAPSANLLLGGNGNIYGSVVGKGIQSSGNGFVHFDLALGDPGYASANGLSYTTGSSGSSSLVNVVNGLQTISWEER